jgi:hypothetical protein
MWACWIPPLTKEHVVASRKVTHSGKDSDGDITALCNATESWSPRAKADAIRDIESGTYTYFVQHAGTNPAIVVVVEQNGRKHLRTTPDSSPRNNLDNLPDC